MEKLNRRTFIHKSVIGGVGIAALPNFPLSKEEEKSSFYSDASGIHFTDIIVREMTGLDVQCPVTGGVPLSEGAAPSGSRFILLDKSNKPVPCQYEVLARWKDGSIRWVLLDFQAKPQMNGKDSFRLTWDLKAKEVQFPNPVKTVQGKLVSVSSGSVRLNTVSGALLRISDRFDVKLILTDKDGKRCEGIVGSAKVETNGKLRSTLLLVGSFYTPEKQRVVDFRLRASVYAGLPKFYLEPQILINADNDMIQYINDLSLEFVPLNPIRSASIGGSPGWNGSPAAGSPVRLLQVDDQNYIFEGTAGAGEKAPGWMEINDGKGTLALTLRDFWQQWPKSLEVDSDVARLGLFPKYKQGTFSHMGPWYKHDYLFEGNSYRLREGQSRRWQVWIDLSGNGENLSKSVNMSLIPAVDPTQAIATGEWGYVAPAGSKGMEEYDPWADNLFEGYCRSIREQRDYGAMNWGDWWGERNCNWGNHEYDTAMQILIQYARTGDPKYFYVAEQAARHYSEVDVIHFVNPELKEYFSQWESEDYPSRPGMVHEHSIGHVGGFHPVERIRQLYFELGVDKSKDPYLCLDPFNLGHIFTLGMAHYYLLTGDPWIKETIDRIGDNLMRLTEDGKYQFKGWNHVGRVNGWSMLALAGVYKIGPEDRCLKAMRHIADEALTEQDPNCGGWLYELSPGHCDCITRKHIGEAGFITSVRLNGLSYYFQLTGDERIPDAVSRGVTHINNNTWMDHKSDWRYTSCPATGSIGQIGVTIMALVNSISLKSDPEQLRILQKAWDYKFARLLEAPKTRPGSGKAYSQIMYGSPEAMNFFVNGNKEK